MSSDSDDDYSYTNSVSVLKALTKKDVSLNSDIDSSRNGINFFDSSGTDDSTPLQARISKKQTKVVEEITDSEEKDEDNIEKIHTDSCIILSDEEPAKAPVNIISAINNVLEKNKRTGRGKGRGRGRGKRKSSPRRTRQSKRLQQTGNDVIVESVSLLNDSSVYVVEDTPDLDEVNFEITVKVYWKSQYLQKFTMRRFDKLTNIFQHFSDKEDIPENRLLFTIKDKIISKNDTPDNLNITAATIIEGGVLSVKTNLGDSKSKGDQIELKVQMKDKKHPLLICLRLDDRMDVLMCKCAQEIDLKVNTLKFYFDGDLIKSSDTPRSLELEGGEIIDCKKKIK